MFNDFPKILLLALIAILIATTIFYPQFLSDDGNDFLFKLMGVELLSVLGFVNGVGNAAILSIVLQLNHLTDNSSFRPTRARVSLRRSAFTLIYAFVVALLVVIVKPWVSFSENLNALMNGFGLLCIFASISVLRDVTHTVFAIPTIQQIREAEERNRASESDCT